MKAVFSLAMLAALFGCGLPKTSENKNNILENESLNEQRVYSMSDYRILKVGGTLVYVPISWIYCSNMLSNASENLGPRRQFYARYLNPPFSEGEPVGTVHDLVRNPEMLAHGLGFRVANCRGHNDVPLGIDPRSSVYEISFEHRSSEADGASPELLRELINAPSDHGWVLRNGIYFDVSEPNDLNRIDSLPLVSGPLGGDSNSARYRHNADMLVSFRWLQGAAQVDLPQARITREQVRRLVDWLTTDPSRREQQPNFLIGKAR